MEKQRIQRLTVFIFSTIIFCIISVLLRDVFVNFYNNRDLGIFTVDYIKNYGAAFSLFHTHTSSLIVISSIVLITTLYYIIRNILTFTKPDFIFYSMLTAGILCNLSERLFDGFVTDYIRLNMVAFPIFNISDLFICIGAFILICNILFSNEQQN